MFQQSTSDSKANNLRRDFSIERIASLDSLSSDVDLLNL